MLDPVIGTVASAGIVTAAFTWMGRTHGKTIDKLTRDFAAERRVLINHILSGTTAEFVARQRATEAPPEPVTPKEAPKGFQMDV